MVERADPIVIVPYDERWPVAFTAQSAVLTELLEPVLVRPIEHIGSTAVRGLPAKPIIDMLALVLRIGAIDALVSTMRAAGWRAAPEPHDEARRRRSFCHPDVERRTHHLHVVEDTSPDWPGWLAFRDHLRESATDRDQYVALKRRLAEADDRDRPAYRAGKAPFIRSVTERALGHSAR